MGSIPLARQSMGLMASPSEASSFFSVVPAATCLLFLHTKIGSQTFWSWTSWFQESWEPEGFNSANCGLTAEVPVFLEPTKMAARWFVASGDHSYGMYEANYGCLGPVA